MSLEWKTDKIVSQTENTVYAYIANKQTDILKMKIKSK